MGCISPNPLNTNPESSSAIPASDLDMSADFADPKISQSVENAPKIMKPKIVQLMKANTNVTIALKPTTLQEATHVI